MGKFPFRLSASFTPAWLSAVLAAVLMLSAPHVLAEAAALPRQLTASPSDR